MQFNKNSFLVLVNLCVILLSSATEAATKVHVVALGKWTSAQIFLGNEEKPVTIKIRPLVIDGRIKEYVLGATHDVTDRLFAVRRVFRVNDSLPDDSSPHWQWQRGGWLLVDRLTGHVSAINLPEFDAFYSPASWYRDYVAYCGVADDGRKTFAIVAQLNRRKPVLKKPIADGPADYAGPDSACPLPEWQRSPVRVTFQPTGSDKQTFAIRGHIVDLVNDADEEDDSK